MLKVNLKKLSVIVSMFCHVFWSSSSSRNNRTRKRVYYVLLIIFDLPVLFSQSANIAFITASKYRERTTNNYHRYYHLNDNVIVSVIFKVILRQSLYFVIFVKNHALNIFQLSIILLIILWLNKEWYRLGKQAREITANSLVWVCGHRSIHLLLWQYVIQRTLQKQKTGRR